MGKAYETQTIETQLAELFRRLRLLENTGGGNSQYLLIDGSRSMTGALGMGTHKITGVVDPTADQEAATKKYVDDHGGGSGDVVGPGSAVDENIAVFDSTTGKLIKDSGINISAVTANTTHRSSDGSDHTFIDQDVTSASTPTFGNDNFTEAADKNYVTDAEAVVIGNTSGANTGDQNDHGALDGLADNDHTQYVLHSLADAANDFLVASGDNTFVKKTLAETGAILEGDIDHSNLQNLSTGAAHSYIDQDVTTTGTPTFGITTLGDSSQLASSAAPTDDADIANKKYVDDNIVAGGANTALSNLAAVAINLSLVSDTDITDDLGTGDIRWKDIHAATLNAGLTATDTLKLRGRDVDGSAYIDILTITSANTVTADLNAITTIGGNAILDATSTVSALTTVGTIGTGAWEATDVGAAHGGTGRSSHTAYAVLCGGTTATAAQQSIAGVGTSGQVLTSNGAGALPTFQAGGGGGQTSSCKVYNSSNQSLANNTETTLSFNSEVWDNDTLHDTVTNNSRITVPADGAGMWLIIGEVTFQTNGTNDRRIVIFQNGSLVALNVIKAPSAALRLQICYIAEAANSDYFELRAWQNSGGSLNAESGVYTFFECHRLS